MMHRGTFEAALVPLSDHAVRLWWESLEPDTPASMARSETKLETIMMIVFNLRAAGSPVRRGTLS
jgi:hypothetical protein